jgi:hypothetical protein
MDAAAMDAAGMDAAGMDPAGIDFMIFSGISFVYINSHSIRIPDITPSVFYLLLVW